MKRVSSEWQTLHNEAAKRVEVRIRKRSRDGTDMSASALIGAGRARHWQWSAHDRSQPVVCSAFSDLGPFDNRRDVLGGDLWPVEASLISVRFSFGQRTLSMSE